MPWMFGIIQNSAGDAGSAGWWAVMLLMILLFVDPEMRARPRRLIDALSNAGILISTLYLMFLAVSIIDFCLKFTGLPVFISLDVLTWLKSLNLGDGGSFLFQLIALALTMMLAVRSWHGHAGGAGLYQCRFADGAGAGRPRHRGLHRAYVYLLLRGRLGDHPAGGAGSLCRCQHNQGKTR